MRPIASALANEAPGVPQVPASLGVARGSRRVVRVEHVMGTAIRVEIDGAGVDESSANDVFAWFRQVDERFSMYRADSEMSRLARGEVRASDAHADIQDVLDLCEDVRVRSRGAFDIWRHRDDGLPDPTGLVKGWSVDRAGALLIDAGLEAWSINAGGDILVHGHSATGPMWRVGIQHPQRADAIAAVITGTDMAVATSGAYERGDHIVDPRGAASQAALLSVTVVGPELALADAFATAAFAMGSEAATWLASIPDYDGGVITVDERVIWTAGMDRWLGRVD